MSFAQLVAEEELKDVARGYRELGVSIGMVASCWISQAFLNTFEWQEVFVLLLLPVRNLKEFATGRQDFSAGPCRRSRIVVIYLCSSC